MIMGLGIGDREADRDQVEKGRFGDFYAIGAEIIADMENKFKRADPRRGGGDQRRVGAPIGVGRDFGEKAARAIRADFIELEGDASGGTTAHNIEYMGRKSGHRVASREGPLQT